MSTLFYYATVRLEEASIKENQQFSKENHQNIQKKSTIFQSLLQSNRIVVCLRPIDDTH